MLLEMFAERYTSDPASAPAVRAAATDYVRQDFVLFEAALGEGLFVLGTGLTALDVQVRMLCYWIDRD
jgi:glutathione S-transferase